MHLFCIALFTLSCLYTLYGLLSKCELEIAGYWPSSFFFFSCCVFMELDGVEVHKHAKVERDNLAILTEQALSKMDSFRSIFLRDTGVIPSSGSQSQRRIQSSCPLTKLAIYANFCYCLMELPTLPSLPFLPSHR